MPNRTTASETTLGYMLVDVVRLLRKDFHARAIGLKVTPALARLLLHISRTPGARQQELAARLEVTPATLGRMVDRLVARGYIRRSADPKDRRAFRVFVAPQGKPLVRRMEEVAGLTKARATRGLSSQDQGRLLEFLQKICSNLSHGSI